MQQPIYYYILINYIIFLLYVFLLVILFINYFIHFSNCEQRK